MSEGGEAAPDLSGEPGWKAVKPMKRGSFVSGEPEGDRIRMQYYLTEDGRLVAMAWFGPGAIGPPGHAHGGSSAAILDEIMGLVAWNAGHAVVAARLTIDYRKLVPLGIVARVEAEVDRVEGRRVYVAGRLVGPTGEVLVEGEGLYVKIGEERFKQLASEGG